MSKGKDRRRAEETGMVYRNYEGFGGLVSQSAVTRAYSGMASTLGDAFIGGGRSLRRLANALLGSMAFSFGLWDIGRVDSSLKEAEGTMKRYKEEYESRHKHGTVAINLPAEEPISRPHTFMGRFKSWSGKNIKKVKE